MSVAFANAVVEGMRRHGIHVHFRPGWDRRGNGQSSTYAGAIVHHTAGAFDGGMDLLVNGRRDLSGPLCNMAGHRDGSVTLVAAHPANHAGASGGRSMGPLPTTRSFNRLVWGLEIMYPGTVPMSPQQYRTAQIMSGVVCGILKRPSPEWARAHGETSVTGKWDPGYANGKTYNMADFRRGIMGALNSATPAPAPPGRAPGVGGEIGRVYHAHFRSLLGPPTTDERTCPDGKGKYNYFTHRNGCIYWYPGIGAWAVYGEIQKAWARIGHERSRLGYPISHEYAQADGGRRSNFQRGYIVWYARSGATVVYR